MVLMLISLDSGHSAERPLRVAYPVPAGAFLTLWAAQDSGIVKRHGLSVELIAVGSSTRGVAAMASGQLDVLAGGGSSGITFQLQGLTDLALFGNIIRDWSFAKFVAKKQRVRELAGLSESGARYVLTAFVAKRSFLS